MKKSSKLLFIILFLASLILTGAALPLVAGSPAAEAVDWDARVTVASGDGYTDLSNGDTVTTTTSLFFLASGNPNDSFQYYVSAKNVDDTISSITSWTSFPMDDEVTHDGKTFERIQYNSENKVNIYVYIRRVYTESGVQKYELYPVRWKISINMNLGESDIGFANDNPVTGEYNKNGTWTEYNGEWLGDGIRFTVTTLYMETNNTAYNPGDELLFYSVDGKEATDETKTWIPMASNSVTVTSSLKEGTVMFKVTDISRRYAQYHEYGKKVSIDTKEPVFNLEARTTDVNGTEISYSNGSWSCNDVTFSFSDNSECVSPIEYQVSTDGITYSRLEGSVYRVNRTTAGLRFRAVNGAGVVYNYNSGNAFQVNIDKISPVIYLEGYTPDPEDETQNKNLNAVFNQADFTYKAGYANGQVIIQAFNRDVDGNYIVNDSGAEFYYAVGDGEGGFGEYRKMTVSSLQNGQTCYILTDTITKEVVSARQYKFYVISGAGKKSPEAVFSVTLVNSVFNIEVQDITYTTNSSGWSAVPIPVYVTVPSDSEILRDYEGNITGYTEPTAKYTFFYSPTNIAGVLYRAEGEYYAPVENTEGMSVYRFYLSASAESTFTIYAQNAAGKRSANTFVSPNVIKIDTVKPTVETTAYIKPEISGYDRLVYIASGQWVNGRIVVTLRVKDGVSGVYVKDMSFAVDASGNPIYNENGELVWQESSSVRQPDGTEDTADGRYYIYNIEIGLPDGATVMMSKEYRFRVYTGSGIYTEESFLANIDISDIVLESITAEVDGESTSSEVIDNVITIGSVCKDVKVTLFSNLSQQGHFDYYYFDTDKNAFVKVEGNEIYISVPQGLKGEIVKEFYLVSKAINYLEESKTTDIYSPYRLVVPYNTLNISIRYELLTDTSGEISSDKWTDGNLSVRITLQKDDEGTEADLTEEEKRNYTYYYMLIGYKTGQDLTEEINKGAWIVCDGGDYDGNGTFIFEVDFTGQSFYGYIALSVTNEAGFRSSTAGDVIRLMRIDRTTPDTSDMIITSSGIKEESNLDGKRTITYYTKDALTLSPKQFSDRSAISYYYYAMSGEDDASYPRDNPTSDNLNGWTKLTSDLVIPAENATFYYIFYIVNELGNYTEGVADGQYTVLYKFVVDTSAMGGNLSYNPNDGGYFDQSLNMYAYIWKENAKITLYATSSNTLVRYYYSIDDGKTWALYVQGGTEFFQPGEANAVELVFNGEVFPEGVNSAFTFKAVNKAGAEYIFDQKIYIAIDTAKPTFEITTTVNGVPYNGGDDNLSSESAANWSNIPVTINIEMTTVNASGYKLEYQITYSTDTGLYSTPFRETPALTGFTTDRLDGFDRNRDALVTIRATSRADSDKYTEETVRIKVDQVVPVFSLTGLASNDDSSQSRVISSGEWTNYKQVTITKAADANHKNVSGVTYTYVYTDLESTTGATGNWPEGNLTYDKICTLTVTATTDAGLTHTEVFQVNIDTIPPVIKFKNSEEIQVVENEIHYIDLQVYIEEENIEICEYITVKGETRGFALDPTGYILSTSSVDNSTRYDPANNNEEYRGYVKIYVKDYAGNTATFELYIHPFALDVNNVTLSDADRRTVEKYEEDLNAAESYMEPSRVVYFRNLISRLKDRITTLENEIETYRAYLERLSQRTSFELKSDYPEMYEYLETYNNYALYGQAWIQDAIKGDASSKYYGYFENLLVVFESLQKEMDMVYAVEDSVKKLPAINMAEAGDYNDVLRVYDAYNDMTTDQKSCFTTNLYTKLLALKKRCEILLLSDEETGVNLDAQFAPGAKIKVETFSSDSEYFTNAQSALFSATTEDDARAVISIYRVSLTGAASQTATGDIIVNLPIPEDYRQYIRFAVYKLGADGTVTPIEGMKIEGDGKSVTFTSDELSTFVLAAKANIQANVNTEETYGTFLGLDLDVEMIRTLAIIGGSLLVVIIIVVIIAGIRHKRFLNTYNRAYKSGIYRRGIQNIPKGNTVPRENPLNPEDRVREQRKPY